MPTTNIPVKKSSSSARPRVSPMSLGTDLDRLESRLNQMWDNFFNMRTPSLSRDMGMGMEENIYPALEIQESDDQYSLEADLPGLNQEDVEIDFHDNILTLKGEKKLENEQREEGMLKSERYYGSFRRDIPFDDEIDSEKVKATLQSGVLKVELPKRPEQVKKHKKIEIES